VEHEARKSDLLPLHCYPPSFDGRRGTISDTTTAVASWASTSILEMTPIDEIFRNDFTTIVQRRPNSGITNEDLAILEQYSFSDKDFVQVIEKIEWNPSITRSD
jgi:hypothetical protein